MTSAYDPSEGGEVDPEPCPLCGEDIKNLAYHTPKCPERESVFDGDSRGDADGR